METLGRITASILLGIVGAVLQKIGAELIRIPHEPFDMAEFGGYCCVGLGWLAFFHVKTVWERRPALAEKGE